MPCRLRPACALAGALACLVGCRIAPPLKVGGEVVWSEAAPESGAQKVEELKVTAGDIVRFETTTPIRVGEVMEADDGEAVVWQTLVPEDGFALLRAGLFTSGVRASPEAFRSVHTGAARKPEFAWFELEENAVDWGTSPLGTPFPKLSDAKRFDPRAFAELDEALGSAFPDPGRTGVARDVTRAVRTLAALRAVTTLEGLRGFPYALNWDIDLPTTGAPRVIDTRRYVLVDPGHGIPINVSGPVELFVWARIARTKADAEVVVRVTEDGRVRGSTAGLIRRGIDRDLPEGSELSQLRHVIVHVPPGEHSYLIEPQGTPAWVSAELSHPAARLEHVFSSTWREAPLLETAKAACEPASFGPACALALAAAGEEQRPEFARALAMGNDVLRRAAQDLSRGGPADYGATLESRAMAGDADAATELAGQARDTVDSSMHDAWKRMTLRATRWEPVASGAPTTKWLSFLPAKKPGGACEEAGGLGSRRELTAAPATFHAAPWRRAHALDVVAIAPCEGEPIALEVDGQLVTAQPGEPRALWHIVVAGDTARVRRVDRGPGHVYAMGDDECSSNVETTRAPERLDAPRALSFPGDAGAVGLELWVALGRAKESVTVHGANGRETLAVDVRPKAGERGIDEANRTWVRAARVALPAWAAGGVTVEGSATTAVRAIVRRERGAAPPPQAADVAYAATPDEAEILDLSRRIRAARDARVRAGLLEQRALLLASYGARTAALDDASEATRLGGTADLAAVVERAVRPVAPKESKLPLPAYGLEPDFDTGAARCGAARGPASTPRAEIAALEAALRVRPADAPFDRELAVHTLRAIAAAPGDPRADALERIALRGSSWHLSHDLAGGSGRVPRPVVSSRDRIFDPEGRLRPDLLTGHALGDDFVTVTSEAPARALLGGGPKMHLDVLCIARSPTAGQTPCPFTFTIGSAAPHVLSLPPGQVAPVEIPPTATRTPLSLSIPKADADYAALVRVVFDRQVEGTAKVDGVGWVLRTPHTQHRTLVTPAHAVRLDVKHEDVVRIDARAEPGAPATVVASVDGREVPVRVDGEPLVVAVPAGGAVVVAARSGEATIAVAERVADDARPAAEKAPARPAARTGDVTLDFSRGRWQEVARRSPLRSPGSAIAWVRSRPTPGSRPRRSTKGRRTRRGSTHTSSRT